MKVMKSELKNVKVKESDHVDNQGSKNASSLPKSQRGEYAGSGGSGWTKRKTTNYTLAA